MRTIVVVIIIVLILSLFISYEKINLHKFCNIMQKNITKIEIVSESNQLKDIINKIIADWNREKKILFAFINHNSFKEIESELFNLKYYIYNDNKDKTSYHLKNLQHKIHELEEINKFNLSNILYLK